MGIKVVTNLVTRTTCQLNVYSQRSQLTAGAGPGGLPARVGVRRRQPDRLVDLRVHPDGALEITRKTAIFALASRLTPRARAAQLSDPDGSADLPRHGHGGRDA